MSQPLTPVGVARHLATLTDELARLNAQLAAADLVAARARHDFDTRMSMSYLQVSGPADFRRHTAIRVTTAYRLKADEADVEVRRLRREIDLVKTRIEVGRTLAASLRAEYSTLPYMEG